MECTWTDCRKCGCYQGVNSTCENWFAPFPRFCESDRIWNKPRLDRLSFYEKENIENKLVIPNQNKLW